jgi:hypothetical protein
MVDLVYIFLLWLEKSVNSVKNACWVASENIPVNCGKNTSKMSCLNKWWENYAQSEIRPIGLLFLSRQRKLVKTHS